MDSTYARYHSPLEDEPVDSAKRDTGETKGSDPLENKVSITQDPPLSGERREGTHLTRFVFDQTGWAQVHITAQSHVVPKKKSVYLRWPGVAAW